MPASPESKTIWPAPPQALRRRSRNRTLSAARPTRSVSPRRLKAALRCGDALDREGFDWLGEALDRSPAEVAQPEQVADEAAGGAGENDLSGFGESLQARREIGGLA